MAQMVGTMKISVTQDDIDKGQRGSACSCPIALATRRAFPWLAISVSPGFGHGWLFIGNKTYRLPGDALTFILEFDSRSVPVAPFEFFIGEE